VHHAIAVHIAASLACAIAVLAGDSISFSGLTVFFACLLLARGLGERIGRVWRGLSRIVSPLLAPVDGAALLLDWMVAPILRRTVRRRLSQEHRGEAYDDVVELMQRTVEQVMTPRSEVVWLRAEASIAEITETARSRPHAQWPVFEGDFERLVGMVDLVDLPGGSGGLPGGSASPPGGLGHLRGAPSEQMTAADLARPAVVVPETVGCDDLLERMRRDHFDTAVVVDEFAGIAGLVTLEDLLEVVVGELIGEHEAVRVRARKNTDGSYIADASLRIDEFEDLFGVSLPEGDYETLAGLFLSRVVRLPEVGERVSIDGLRLEVMEADTHRIRSA
jgi:CBS domain containing-hemolysin-like protein